jgi:hypothetical protein
VNDDVLNELTLDGLGDLLKSSSLSGSKKKKKKKRNKKNKSKAAKAPAATEKKEVDGDASNGADVVPDTVSLNDVKKLLANRKKGKGKGKSSSSRATAIARKEALKNKSKKKKKKKDKKTNCYKFLPINTTGCD